MSAKNSKTERCAACGEDRPKTTLVMLVGDPVGRLAVDLKGKLATPGVFVCLNRRCLDRLEVDGLARATGIDRLDAQDVAALPERIGAALSTRVKSLLGMAQRSGNLTSGTSAAMAALKRAPPSGWIAVVARDASPDVARRLCRAAQARGVTLVRYLTTIELGDSIGKSPRCIVVIEDAGLARSARETIARLEAIMGRDVVVMHP